VVFEEFLDFPYFLDYQTKGGCNNTNIYIDKLH
jgi:hypothetical protein